MRRRGSFRERPNNEGRKHQPTRRDQIRQRNAEVQEMLTAKRRMLKFIVSTLQPLERTKDSIFLASIKILNPTLEIPTNLVLNSELVRVYDYNKTDLKSILKPAHDIVLTSELWSLRGEDSYLTVGCHFVDTHGKLKSYILKTTSLLGDESEANVQSQLSAIVEDWDLKEKVHSVVGAGMQQLKNVKAKWAFMPCFADTLNTVFKDLKNNDELSDVLKKCQNIVRFFKNDSDIERELREIQKRLDKNQDELLLYCGDRWMPWLQMLQGLIKQYPVMQMVFAEKGKTNLNLTGNDTEKINQIISALEPFREATSMMKTDGFETISMILLLLKKLLGSLKGKAKTNDIAKTLFTKCKKEFGDINNHSLALNTFLDPRLKNQLGDQNIELAKTKIVKELTAGPSSSSSPQQLKDLLDRYVAYKPTNQNSNPLAWWQHTGMTRFGELSRLALKKLGVVSTAVPLERAFSEAGDRFSSLRSSIEPENLNMVLFLNSNWS